MLGQSFFSKGQVRNVLGGGRRGSHVLIRGKLGAGGSELTRDSSIKQGLAALGAGVLSPALLPSLLWPRREVRKGRGGDPGGR